jgi:hypothetical protein
MSLIDNKNIILEIYRRSSDDKSWLPVHEFEPDAENVNPVFRLLKISG